MKKIDFDSFKKVINNLNNYWSFLDDDEYGDYDKKDEKFFEYVRILEDYMFGHVARISCGVYTRKHHRELYNEHITRLQNLYLEDKQELDDYLSSKELAKEKERQKTNEIRKKVEGFNNNDAKY